ncbi:MAG: hypothetical protein GX321_02150, partial [Clostridiales bacterium]|nr:hypothetical protein [Clostridiales bacterium]
DGEVYDLLFSDAKATILRFKNTYKYNNSKFAPKPELKIYQEAKKRAEAYGEEVIVLMSSWSPAAYLKENDSIVGGASLKKDEDGNYMYDEYGQYWLELIQAYEDYGIPIDYISIQNECDFVADYDGCEFGMMETDTLASYSKAYLAVYEAISTMDDPPKMMGPETMTIDSTQLAAYMKEVFEKAPESVYGIAHHLYAGGTHETPNSYITHMLKIREDYPHLSKWQTEFYRGNVMQTVWIMHNSLTMENLNAYLYWDGVWALPGNIIGLDNPWTKWNFEKGYVVRDNYYAIRHFTEFIRPGYKRIDVAQTKDMDLLVSAYAPDSQDKMAVVVINKSDEDKLIQLNFSAYELESSETYISVCQEGYTQEDLYVPSGPLGEHQTILVPAQGIITMDLTGKANDDIVIKDGTGTKTKEDDSAVKVNKILDINNKVITIGEDNSEIWKDQKAEAIENVANGDHGASGEFKAVWSDEYLYIRVQVNDNTPDTSGTNYHDQDSVEVFINKDHTKPSKYGLGDQHYIINRDNIVTAGSGADLSKFQSIVTSDKQGYVVELAIPFKDFIPTKNGKLGFEIQINDSHRSGIRNYALKWSSTSLNTSQSLEGIGTLNLK